MQTVKTQRRISKRIEKLESESHELAERGIKSLANADKAKDAKARANCVRIAHNCQIAVSRLRDRITKLSERLIPREGEEVIEFTPKKSGIQYNGSPLSCMA